MKIFLLKLRFNNVAGLKAWHFIKKRHWHRYFLVNFPQFFKKHYLQNTSRWLLLLIPPFQPKFLSICSFFPSLFSFYYWLLQLWDFTQKVFKNKVFLLFTIFFSKIDKLLRQFSLDCNLPTHANRLPLAKPWQLQRADANFEGWY